MEWPKLDELVQDLQSGNRDLVELVQNCLDEIDKTKEFNAVLEVNPKAIEQAKQLAKSSKKGRLYGVPFIAKDNFLTNYTHTTAASNILKPFKAPFQATAIEKLEDEGAILIAKANLDSFAHGSSTENSDFGPTKNPHDKTRVPGGSSGGSAAAVALGLCGFALGTDTGGSIRLPASYCGVVGLKPTYGLVSRYGVIAMASSTDVIGPLARNVDDAALVLDVMAGKDNKDATLVEREPSYTSTNAKIKGLKVGIIKEHIQQLSPEMKQLVQDCVDTLKARGAVISEVSIPSFDEALAAYYIIVPAEVSSNLARYDGIKYGLSSEGKSLFDVYETTRSEGFNDENKRRILVGTYVLSSGYYDAYYNQAQKVRGLLVKELDNAFAGIDMLIGPASTGPAFKFGAKSDPLDMYLVDIMTVGVNLSGVPAIVIPGGKVDNLPVGIQLITAQKDDARLLSVASELEGAHA